jgi:hypothetical protein
MILGAAQELQRDDMTQYWLEKIRTVARSLVIGQGFQSIITQSAGGING